MTVQVLSSSGTVLSTLATYSNLGHNTGYTQHSVSLAPYAGQSVTLKFTGTEDSELQPGHRVVPGQLLEVAQRDLRAPGVVPAARNPASRSTLPPSP